MTRGIPLRVRAGAYVVLMFALASNAQWIGRVARSLSELQKVDEISAYEHRLAPLRAHLNGERVVGYLSDPEPPALSRSESRSHYRKFLLTRYTLVPILVVRSSAVTPVVGNFDEPSSAGHAADLGLETVADLGDGIVLFRKRAE